MKDIRDSLSLPSILWFAYGEVGAVQPRVVVESNPGEVRREEVVFGVHAEVAKSGSFLGVASEWHVFGGVEFRDFEVAVFVGGI